MGRVIILLATLALLVTIASAFPKGGRQGQGEQGNNGFGHKQGYGNGRPGQSQNSNSQEEAASQSNESNVDAAHTIFQEEPGQDSTEDEDDSESDEVVQPEDMENAHTIFIEEPEQESRPEDSNQAEEETLIIIEQGSQGEDSGAAQQFAETRGRKGNLNSQGQNNNEQ